jgi:ubiquinone biosynthesis protein COQ4
MATMEQQSGEVRAAQAALSGTRWERAALGAGALRRLMRDPDDTAQVFVMGLALNARRFPDFLARFAVTEGGARLLRERPSIDSSSVDLAALRALPASTLGGAYARYLDDHRLDPDLFQTPPGLPEIPGFLARRLRQTHDIWHTLTGYQPDVPGEVALQAFTYAQTGMPSAFLIALLGSLRWGLATHDLPRRALDAYERGKEAAFLAPVIWEEQWGDDLEAVRARYNIRPAA